jgi:hypothetical protein
MMQRAIGSSEKGSDPQGLTPTDRPTLHLSGAKLRAAFAALVRASEPIGGIERFAEAVKLKAHVFQEWLAEGRATMLDRVSFEEIVPLMPTVRRRVGAPIDELGWPRVRTAIAELLHEAHVPGMADRRMMAFEKALSLPSPRARGEGPRRGDEGQRHDGASGCPSPGPSDHPLPVMTGRGNAPRFLRDLAAELLHGVHPEHHPLMTRWVWDTKANTGVLREIWHDPVTGDDVDRIVIDIPDTHETFLVLREELSQFLAANGIFRDMLWYVDLLQAQIYGDYINAQGGAWLKTEFAAESDPLEHTRRILGLDRVHGRRHRRADVEAEAVLNSSRALPPEAS